MPMEGDQTLGVAFLVTRNGRDAAKMVSAIDGVAFDKKHTLSALSRADFEYALEAPEEYEEPDEEELKRTDKPLALTANMARIMSCVAAGQGGRKGVASRLSQRPADRRLRLLQIRHARMAA